MQRMISTNGLGRWALCVVLLAVISTNVTAQAGAMPSLWEGARLRVTSPALGPQRQVVTVLGQHADTIVVRVKGRNDSTALRAADITRLELSRGIHTQVRKGMVIGAISGAALGAVISYATYKKPECTNPFGCIEAGIENRSSETTLGAVGGGLLGVVVGAAAGTVWRVENWEYLPIGGRGASLRLVPIDRGVALSAAF